MILKIKFELKFYHQEEKFFVYYFLISVTFRIGGVWAIMDFGLLDGIDKKFERKKMFSIPILFTFKLLVELTNHFR